MNNRVARLINRCSKTNAQRRASKRDYNNMSHQEKTAAKKYMNEYLDAVAAGVAT